MRELALNVVRRLQGAGYEACWVGGCVRDRLLGKEPRDYDVATSARPEEVERLFGQTVPVGKQFGVVLVVEGGATFQVATYRAEADYQDGRRPSRVTYADARADAMRRDFTVNGLFYDPVTERLFDWVGGEADLRARRLRAIGVATERFAEDHLRLLRAVRFAAQLGFEIEEGTWVAVRLMAEKVRQVAAERVREELVHLFEAPHAGRGLELLRASGLLEHVLPEIAACVGCEQSPDFHPEGSVYEHVRLMLEQLPVGSGRVLAWAALLHDVGKPPTATRDGATGGWHFYGHERVGAELAERVLRRLRFPRKELEEIVFCVRHHMQFKDVPRMRRATLRRLLLRPTFQVELELHRLDCVASHGRLDHHAFLVREWEALASQPALRPPLVDGEDLKRLGMRAGPELGAMLREVRDRQLQEELRDRESALVWVRERLRGAPAP